MKLFVVLLMVLTPVISININTFHDEIEEIDFNKLKQNDENINDAEELNDVLKGKIENYLIGKLAAGKYLDHSDAIDGTDSADPLHDETQNDENEFFQKLSDYISANDDDDNTKNSYAENDGVDDENGGGSDKNDLRSPIEIDENLNGKVINEKGEIITHGDIVMTKEEENKYFGPKTDNEKKDIAQDIDKGVSYWTNSIMPYVLESSLESVHKTAINAAIAEFNDKTCIRLVPRTTQNNYVSFFKGTGCWSYIGMRGGKQQISLGTGCGHRKTAIHEVMHALGFWHEQSRPDRDNYVTINLNNVQSGQAHNFNKYTGDKIESFGHPYDYRSIMHYSKTEFGKYHSNGERAETITPKIKTELGQCWTCGMTETDNAQLIRLYCSQPQSTIPSVTILNNELKMMMSAFRGQSNEVFRKTLLAHMRRRYPGYDWTISSYNAVSGDDKHAYEGNCGHVYRYYDKNVVACYSKKSTQMPSVAKRNEIANAVINSVKDKGCNAKTVRDIAWKKANSYGYPISMIHNVRHGSGLWVQWFAVTNFWNYRCQRECKNVGWWLRRKQQCTDHMSSLVLMFGGP